LITCTNESEKEFCIPLSQCLFDAIQGFIEFVDSVSGLPLSSKTKGKQHVYIFIKIIMEEGVVNVKLVKEVLNDTIHLTKKKKKKPRKGQHLKIGQNAKFKSSYTVRL